MSNIKEIAIKETTFTDRNTGEKTVYKKLNLYGYWLAKLGFKIGRKVSVYYDFENCRIIAQVLEEGAENPKFNHFVYIGKAKSTLEDGTILYKSVLNFYGFQFEELTNGKTSATIETELNCLTISFK